MTKHKVSELEGALLDAAVALAGGRRFVLDSHTQDDTGVVERWAVVFESEGRRNADRRLYPASTDWSIGGPIIERERIDLDGGEIEPHWIAHCRGTSERGPTTLIAAMRAYVASKFGEEVDLPYAPSGRGDSVSTAGHSPAQPKKANHDQQALRRTQSAAWPR